jgi:large subunit ribosomal protein L3
MNTNMGILGRKIGMTQIFDEAGMAVPVTAVRAGPCVVLQVKTKDSDGYNAIQIGFDDYTPRNVPDETRKKAQGKLGEYDMEFGRITKPLRRHFFKAETAPKRFVREIRLTDEDVAKFELGQEIKTDSIEKGQFVDVVGTSKGRGFTGVIKRHNFRMFQATHGTHEWRRHGGSIGCRKPMHVIKGTRMAGQHGNQRITVQNLKIADVNAEQNLILIRGGIPGPNGSYVVVRTAIKK